MSGSKRISRLKAKSHQKAETKKIIAQKAVGYIRVSTEEQAANGYGLEAQEKAIRAFAESQGYELIHMAVDAGISGAKKPEERPGYQSILHLAQESAFSVLLVWKFDRLARSLVYAVTSANELQETYGVILRSVTEPIDTGTPMGQTIFAVLAGMAAQERLAITQRTWGGRKAKAEKGGFAGGPAPMGYCRDKEGGLEIVADEAEVVRRIYSLRRQRKGYKAIADALNKEGFPTKRGGKWYAATIRYILDNPKYKGLIEYYFKWEGEGHVLRQGNHKSILSAQKT